MPRSPSDFKLNNIVRARRAAERAGMYDPIIEIDPRNGVIRLIPNGGKAPAVDERGDEWDEAVAKLEGRPA
jgi:hypothetical protein